MAAAQSALTKCQFIIDQKKIRIPEGLQGFLIKVDRLIEEVAYEISSESSDAIEDHGSSGGLIAEGPNEFGFTYIDDERLVGRVDCTPQSVVFRTLINTSRIE